MQCARPQDAKENQTLFIILFAQPIKGLRFTILFTPGVHCHYSMRVSAGRDRRMKILEIIHLVIIDNILRFVFYKIVLQF
jgi:hypothetical protein